ncbi:MAG: hypothetical protein K2X87_22060 [Gemmataceae bacterium]|nr:hypothetical protein [Gemmataceae bacterium]
MADPVPTDPKPGSPEAHWSNTDPTAQPPQPLVMGLPRLVLEARTRIGPDATPEQVAEELKAGGVDTDVESVRAVWDEGHA